MVHGITAELEVVEKNATFKRYIVEGFNQGPVSVKNLAEMSIDCLERVLRKLSISDLVNVADAHENLKEAAEMVFKIIMYKRKRFTLNSKRLRSKVQNINKFRNYFKILRCFGHLIPHLRIFCNGMPSNLRIHLEQYISEYCSERLTGIEIWKGDENTFEGLKKPFVNVERVSISGGNMYSQIVLFNEWFPKMNHLVLGHRMNQNSDMDNLEVAIRMNQQLRHLSIGANWNAKVLEIISKLPLLETFSLYWDAQFPNRFDTEDAKIHFKTVKKLEIFSHVQRIWPTKRFGLPLKFEQLEDLKLINLRYKNCLDFIKGHRTLRHLTVYRRILIDFSVDDFFFGS